MNAPIPRPGEHRSVQVSQELLQPETVARDVDDLLVKLADLESDMGVHDDASESAASAKLAAQAHILERAHDVLVQALATVDKT